MKTEAQETLTDALYEFSLAKKVPDADLLETFIHRYPVYSKELTEFAVELIVDSYGDVSAEGCIEQSNNSSANIAISRAMSRYQNGLHEMNSDKRIQRRASACSEAAPVDPFRALDRNSFQAFSDRVDVSRVFATKLRDRQIDADTIPSEFYSKMADSLNLQCEEIEAYMTQPSTVTARVQSFKADIKPSAQAKQTFEEAINTSMLTEEQRTRLLSLVAKE